MIRWPCIIVLTNVSNFKLCFKDYLIAISYVLMLQMIMLEGAKATTETVDALRTGAAAMKAMQKAT